MSSPTKSELCETAAGAIKEYGWIRCMLGSPQDGFCLIGGIRYAYDLLSEWPYMVTARELANLVIPGIPNATKTDWYRTVTGYNDGVLESKEGAVDTLMEAAKYWRNRGE